MPQLENPNLQTPSELALVCDAGDVVIEARKAEGDAKPAGPPRFTMVAYTGGQMKIDGWRYPVIVDLQGMAIPSQRRPIRFSHSAFQGIGHSERIAIEGNQVVAEGVVSRDTPIAREVVVSSQRGFPWQASIGAAVHEVDFIRNGKTVTVNGQSFQGPTYVARRTTLGEISFVDLGADGNTSASIAAQQTQNAQQNQENENTMPASTATNQTSKNGNDTVETTTSSETEPKPNEPASATPTQMNASAATNSEATKKESTSPIDEMRVLAAAESKRISDVRRICAGKHPEVEVKALAEGWDATRTELEVLRASRPQMSAPAMHSHDNNMTTETLEAACMLTANLGDVEKLHDEQTLDAASRRFRGGIGLQELLLEAAWANGFTGRNFRDNRAVLRYAFASSLPNVEAAAGFSTIDIGGILSNVANKFLLEGFFSVERVWRNITAVRNVSDFKTITSYRLIGKDQYEKVAPGGELKHGNLGEETYSNRADTYGLLLSIDRRDVINDDLGAITTVPRKLGRGSGLKINDVFWTQFMNNVAFFAAGNNNYFDGADTVLGIDGLTNAEVAFMNQVDSDGKPIGVMPAILLVPTSLSAKGTSLYKSLEIRSTKADEKETTDNPHAGKFRVETSRYLANGQYTGNSDKAWYLLSDPSDLPVIETAFLNGQESPTIETAEADFNVLGIQMRGYHDFGVALQEPRGGVKMAGE